MIRSQNIYYKIKNLCFLSHICFTKLMKSHVMCPFIFISLSLSLSLTHTHKYVCIFSKCCSIEAHGIGVVVMGYFGENLQLLQFDACLIRNVCVCVIFQQEKGNYFCFFPIFEIKACLDSYLLYSPPHIQISSKFYFKFTQPPPHAYLYWTIFY